MMEVDEAIHGLERERRFRGWGMIVIALVLGALTTGVYVAVLIADAAQDDVAEIADATKVRDVRIDSLEKALDAQRAQFEACKDKRNNAPGCQRPISPEGSEVGPQGIPGIQGLQGQQGQQGIPGLQGRDGATGATGPAGEQGAQGVPGEDGKDGAVGPAGPEGPPGAMGEDGQDGINGTDGLNGQDGAKGEKGDKGEAGAPGATGPKGDQGAPGVDAPVITGFQFRGEPANCALVVTLSNAVEYSVAVPAVFCTAPAA